MAQVHAALEIYEYRIHFGEDPLRDHPAQAVEAFRQNQYPILVSRRERAVQHHYRTWEEKTEIPAFWEPRSYDRIGMEMSAAESAALEATIREITHRTRNLKKKHGEKWNISEATLQISSKFLDTEDSEGTDWEDF
jgi:hypothetical protein